MNEEFEKWFRAEVVAERMYPADEEGARAAWQESRKQAGWQPIATAPDGQLVVVLWLDKGDIEHPERHAFDFKDEGIWRQDSEDYEHYLCVGGSMGPGPSEQAPYTNWMPLPQPPAMQKD